MVQDDLYARVSAGVLKCCVVSGVASSLTPLVWSHDTIAKAIYLVLRFFITCAVFIVLRRLGTGFLCVRSGVLILQFFVIKTSKKAH